MLIASVGLERWLLDPIHTADSKRAKGEGRNRERWGDSAAARLLGRMDEATKARKRFDALQAVDARLHRIADQWPAFIAMSLPDFTVLCRFLAQIAVDGAPKMRLREIPCAGH